VKIECISSLAELYLLNSARGLIAIFIANGAGLSRFMNVPGENLKRRLLSPMSISRINLNDAWQFPRSDDPVLQGKRVAVVGGGNVAMDAVRTAKRLGAESAMIVYRRTAQDCLPGPRKSIMQRGRSPISFSYRPVEVI